MNVSSLAYLFPENTQYDYGSFRILLSCGSVLANKNNNVLITEFLVSVQTFSEAYFHFSFLNFMRSQIWPGKQIV